MTLTDDLPALAPFAPARPFDLHSATAANGLRIHAIRQAAAPLVTVRVDIPFGVDSPEQTGTAELLAATLFTGTPDLDRLRIEDEIALVGGALRCSVDPERLTVSVTVLSEGLPRTLSIIARCLAEARYPDAELARERAQLVQRVRMADATPGLRARQALYRRCFADHPITRVVPRIEHVTAADADAVRTLGRRNVVPDGSTLLLVGDLEPDRAVDAAAAVFAGWQADHPATALAPLPAVPTGGSTEVLEHPEIRHAMVRMAAPTPGRDDPSHASLYLANLVLGGYFSSRLNTTLRERDGLVYGVQSTLREHAGRGLAVIEFDTDPDTAAAALDRAVADLAALAEDGPSEDETERARRYATGALSLYLTTREGIVDTVGGVLAAGLAPSWVHHNLTRVGELDGSDIARAAHDLLAPEQFTSVILTNRSTSHQGPSEQGEMP